MPSDPLTTEAFGDWCDLARESNEWVPPESHTPAGPPPGPHGGDPAGAPGWDFNARGTWAETGLLDAGWEWVRRLDGDRGTVRRPGKDFGQSGTVGLITSQKNGWPLFWNFSTSAPEFDPDRAYCRFAVFAVLKHGGDFSAAARALRGMGYGAAAGPAPEVTFGTQAPKPPGQPTGDGDTERWSHDDLLDGEFGELRYVVHGLVADESLTILGGVQKAGKSWLSVQLAQAVAGGATVLGRETAQGAVVYLALEDGARRLRDRLVKQGSRRGLPITWYTKFPKLDTAAGWARLCEVAATRPRLLIIDTLAAAKGGKTDESDSGPMADLFNGLRQVAQTYRVAILVVHHHGKSVSGDPAHDLRGSSAIGAAADVLLGLYRVRRRTDGAAAQKADGFDPDDESDPDFYLKARGRDIEDGTLAVRFGAGADWLWSVAPGGTHDGRKARVKFGTDAIVRALEQLGRATAEQVTEWTGQSERTVRGRLKELVAEGAARVETVSTGGRPSFVYALCD